MRDGLTSGLDLPYKINEENESVNGNYRSALHVGEMYLGCHGELDMKRECRNKGVSRNMFHYAVLFTYTGIEVIKRRCYNTALNARAAYGISATN